MSFNEHEPTTKNESFYGEDIISKTLRWPSLGIKCLEGEKLNETAESSPMTFVSAVSHDRVIPVKNTLEEKHQSTDNDGSSVDDASLEVKVNTELSIHDFKSILKSAKKPLPSSPINPKTEIDQLQVHFSSPVASVKLIEENSEGDSDTLILTPDQTVEDDSSSNCDNSDAEDQRVPIQPQGSDKKYDFCGSLEPLPKKFCFDQQALNGEHVASSNIIRKQMPQFCFPKPIETKSLPIYSENKEPEEFLCTSTDLDNDSCTLLQGRENNHCWSEYRGETESTCNNGKAMNKRERICDRLGVAKPETSSSDAKSNSIGVVIATENISVTPDDKNQVIYEGNILKDHTSTIEIRNSSQEPNLQVVPCISRPTDITCCNSFEVNEDGVETTMCTSTRNFLATAVIEECWVEKEEVDAFSPSLPCDFGLNASEDLKSDMPFYSHNDNANEHSKSEKLGVFSCSPVEKLCDSVNIDDCIYETPYNDDLMNILEGRFDSQISINSELTKELPSPPAHYLPEDTLDYNDNKYVDDRKISLEVFTCSPAEYICDSELVCGEVNSSNHSFDISDYSLDSQISIEGESSAILTETVVSVENAIVESRKLENITCSLTDTQYHSEKELGYKTAGCVAELEKIFDSQIQIDTEVVIGEVIDKTVTDVVDELLEATCRISTDASAPRETYLTEQNNNVGCSFGNTSPTNSESLSRLPKVKSEQLAVLTNNKANVAVAKTQDQTEYKNVELRQREMTSNELHFFKILNLSANQKQSSEDFNTEDGRLAANNNFYLISNKTNSQTVSIDLHGFSDDKDKSRPVYETSEAEETGCVVMNVPDSKEAAEKTAAEKVTQRHMVNSKTCVESAAANKSQKEISLTSQPVDPLACIPVRDSSLKMHCGEEMYCSSLDEKQKSGGSNPDECSTSSQINTGVQPAGGFQQGKGVDANEVESARDMERKVTAYMSELPLKIKLDISELDGPDLLEAAMLLVESALKKTKDAKRNPRQAVRLPVKKLEGSPLVGSKMDKQSNASPVFFWKNEFQYESQQLAMVQTKSRDDKCPETGSHGSESPTVMRNSTRPMRLGLSRKQKVKRLHPYWDKRRVKSQQMQADTTSIFQQQEFSETFDDTNDCDTL